MTSQFGAFIASELYCPRCKKAQPVRERLLLVLPSGELHEYLCSNCSHSLGQRTVTTPPTPLVSPRTAETASHPRKLSSDRR
jgi:hypothetical protein